MHKTLYVDVDEEITSIVDRIKTEEAGSIVLVVPKNAMLTQGVINLKLLKKEVEKIGKALTIATNDKHARVVIERLEIKTKEAKGDLTRHDSKASDKEQLAQQASAEALEMIGTEQTGGSSISADDVGTEDFYAAGDDEKADEQQNENETGKDEAEDPGETSSLEEKRTKQEQEPKEHLPMPLPQQAFDGQQLEAEQQKQRMLNQQQLREELYARKKENKQVLPQKSPTSAISGFPAGRPAFDAKPPLMDMRPQVKRLNVKNENPGSPDLFGNIHEQQQVLKTKHGYDGEGASSAKKAEKFFSHEETQELKEIQEQKKKVQKDNKERNPKVAKFWAFLIALMVSVGAFAAIGSWVYANYPKVNITIHPLSKEISKEIKIVAKEGIDSSEISSELIPGEYVEMVISKSMDFDATGETYETDDGKARGKVRILNNYSSTAQQLVATTRLLSTEGKLFRLVEDAVVPGMDGDKPGEVEAAVIADKPGADFNIGPSKFTIEGFKGSPRYTAFEAVSERSMTDGGQPDENKKMPMVTETDIAEARTKAIDALELSLESEIENKLENDLKVIVDSVEKEIQSTKSSRTANEVAATFTYTIEQKVKAMAFSAEDVNFVVMGELEKDIEEGYAMDSVGQVTFKKGIADYENKTLTMYVDAGAVSWPLINQAEIAEEISGKKEAEIKAYLSGYSAIEKAELSISPPWLTAIPISRGKINITEAK